MYLDKWIFKFWVFFSFGKRLFWGLLKLEEE